MDDEIETIGRIEVAYFVLERRAFEWTKETYVHDVCHTLEDAVVAAERLKTKFPTRHFGIAILHSEAHHVAKPVQIVRVLDTPPAGAA